MSIIKTKKREEIRKNMKSKVFLCLLLIASMLAFAGCGDDTGTSGQLKNDARDMVNDVENGIDNMTDGMDGRNGDINGSGTNNMNNGTNAANGLTENRANGVNNNAVSGTGIGTDNATL